MARSAAYYRGYVDAEDWSKTQDQLNLPVCPWTTENAGQRWARHEYADGWNAFFAQHPAA